MGRIITDSRGLVNQPHDPYWDAPLTRREMQRVVNDLAMNDNALMNMNDTSSIVLNFLCEKLEVKRSDLDEFVAKKTAELNAIREKQRAVQNAEAPAGQVATAAPVEILPINRGEEGTAPDAPSTPEATDGPNVIL